MKTKSKASVEGVCDECGFDFRRKSAHQRYCSLRCQNNAAQKRFQQGLSKKKPPGAVYEAPKPLPRPVEPYIPDGATVGPVKALDTGDKSPEEIAAMIERMARHKTQEGEKVKSFFAHSSLDGHSSSGKKRGSMW
jgi:hypothetical protein